MTHPSRSPSPSVITPIDGARVLEERFFDLSIDMLCVLGFNGYFKRLNASLERTLGFTVKEMTARPFIEFVHPDDRARTLNQNGKVRGVTAIALAWVLHRLRHPHCAHVTPYDDKTT